eukprot:11165126-Lingulodinium_polyedra.AAC.1
MVARWWFNGGSTVVNNGSTVASMVLNGGSTAQRCRKTARKQPGGAFRVFCFKLPRCSEYA